MKPAPFVHHEPASVAEAVALLTETGHDGKVLAGGQSLIPMLSMRLATPGHLVDLGRIPGLDTVTVTDAEVRVGAMARHTTVERHREAYAALPLLRQAARNVAHPAIRNRGTTVGSLTHADPSGEMPAVLALTNGSLEVTGPNGTREVLAGDLFLGPLETSLAHDEVAVAAHFPRFADGTRTGFVESSRRSGDYALAGVALAVRQDASQVHSVRAAFVSVTDVPDVLDLSEVCRGDAHDLDLDAVADAVAGHVTPQADIHAGADYRRALVIELTRRLLTELARTDEGSTR